MNSGFNIFDWLPMFFWEGPPLPRFLRITWASMLRQKQSSPRRLPPVPKIFTSLEETVAGQGAVKKPATTYSNIEEIEFPNGFDPETFMPRRIRIKRKTETS